VVISLTKIVLEAFDGKNVRTLDELYSIIEDDKRAKIVAEHLKHRVRSCVWSLTKSNKIKNVGPAKYMKI